jgi:hypothetical protein
MIRPEPFLRISNGDDIREDLELAVMELQDRFGVAPSSIRRFVNSALKAPLPKSDDDYRATAFLRKRWKREQEPSETPSRTIGNAQKPLQNDRQWVA